MCNCLSDTNKSPSYWSRVCLRNIAKLAKEATTVRRVLEPLFQSFDAENHWSPEKPLAYNVLMYMQSLLEESGLKFFASSCFPPYNNPFVDVNICCLLENQEIIPICYYIYWSSTWIIRMLSNNLAYKLISLMSPHK